MGLGPQDRRKGPLGGGDSSRKGWEVGVGRGLARGTESREGAVTGVGRRARQAGAVGLKSKFLSLRMTQSAVCAGNENQCEVRGGN